jgi:hypothetical protein
VRTLLETEWSVPPPGPQTPPPWEQPAQYRQWQQPTGASGGHRERERRKTIVIVTVAVILVVVAVLAGAFILRTKLNSSAAATASPAATASLVDVRPPAPL